MQTRRMERQAGLGSWTGDGRVGGQGEQVRSSSPGGHQIMKGHVSAPPHPRLPARWWGEVSGSAHALLAMGVMASAATETSSRWAAGPVLGKGPLVCLR